MGSIGGSHWSLIARNRFPIFYGQPLKGERLVYGENTPGVRPGRVGVLYEVTTTSGATGYGGGWFRITPDRRVENWRDDPTPAVVNEQGYG